MSPHDLADAIEHDDPGRVRSVLSTIKDVRAVTDGMMLAAQSGKVWALSAMLAAGANADVASDFGVTPLMIAAECDNLDVIDALLVGGAKLEATDRAGWTALFYAARAQRVKALARLLRAGASVTHRDIEMHGPLHIARRKHFSFRIGRFGIGGTRRLLHETATVRLLKNAGAID